MGLIDSIVNHWDSYGVFWEENHRSRPEKMHDNRRSVLLDSIKIRSMFNPFSLEGKRVLVTGASSGIGRSVAIACSKMGAKMVLNGRNQERLDETLAMLEGDGHMVWAADLSSQQEMDSMVEGIPALNGLVHCAGLLFMSAVKHLDSSTVKRIIDTNQTSAILLVSGLLKKKKIQKGSSIVLVASISGVYVSNIGEALYSATKGALSGFAKGAALELAAQGIRVNTICPGIVETPLLRNSNEWFSDDEKVKTVMERYPLKCFGAPEDIANGAIFLLSSASRWITGINLLIDGGYCLV